MTTIGELRHVVTLESPGPPVPDGDGGYTESWQPLNPATWNCSISSANARDLESLTAGTVVAQASHILRGRFHGGITTEARISFEGRTFNVLSVVNRDERDIETVLICSEMVE